MNSCSEYVSLGHPDRTADAIASYLLDEYIRHDPKTRFALEVQLKDHVCNLAGEVTSTWKPSDIRIGELVREAIRKVGYTAEYAARWPEGATLNADNVAVNNFIGQQSPDIAQGVDRDGWGDQGAFMGMATREGEFGYMPRDRFFAHEIGMRLYDAAKVNKAPIGLDIKVLVSLAPEGERVAEKVVVAAPTRPENEGTAKEFIRTLVKDFLGEHGYGLGELVVNGTGSFVIHSSVGDAGVVGRKLAVDFYGLNCPIGGGTTWGKDGSKADVTLNLLARYLSLKSVLASNHRDAVYTKIACCIGQKKVLVSKFDNDNVCFESGVEEFPPKFLIHKFGLDGLTDDKMFYTMCEDGLFSFVDAVAMSEVAESREERKG